EAFAGGHGGVASAVSEALLLDRSVAKAAGGGVAHYFRGGVRDPETEFFFALWGGGGGFPGILRGDDGESPQENSELLREELRIAMKQDLDRQPLSRPIRVDEIKDGAQDEIDATQSELAAIAKLLALKGLDPLSFTYRLNHAGGGRL